jgi:ribose transport system permease protein
MTASSEVSDHSTVGQAFAAVDDAPKRDWVKQLPSFSMIPMLIGLAILSEVLYPGFFDWANLKLLLSQNAPVGIVAVGMTLVMIAGGFDLSVGAIYAIAATLYAILAKDHSLLISGAAALGCGLLAGLLNGVLVAKFNINAFVATLGTSSVIGGLAYIISDSSPQVPTNPSFANLGNNDFAGLPISVWLLIIVMAIGWFVLSRTVYGRSLYALGGNAEASRLAGLRIDTLRISAFTILGVLSAMAGMIIASRLQVGQADVGATVALDSIAVVVIGGTSLFGGEGAMWRTAVGLGILAVLTNLFNSLALDASVQEVAKGGIVLGAVSLDAWLRRRR